jgi:hypothetical protein
LDLLLRGKDKRAAGMAGAAVVGLNRVEARLADVTGAAAIENLVHEASALDGEATVDIPERDPHIAENKPEGALDKKEEAKKRLEAIAKK